MKHSHVYPLNDVIEHDITGDDCVCGPDYRFLPNGTILVEHHSLDGRENHEAERDRRITDTDRREQP